MNVGSVNLMDSGDLKAGLVVTGIAAAGVGAFLVVVYGVVVVAKFAWGD